MKKLIIIVSIVAVLGIIIGLYLYNKPSEFKSTGKPDFEVNLTDFTKEGIEIADSIFNKKYVGKSVRFSGTAQTIKENDGAISIQMTTDQEEVVVLAGFHASVSKEAKSIKAGDKVQLQCECNGVSKPADEEDLLSEIVFTLSRCSVVK